MAPAMPQTGARDSARRPFNPTIHSHLFATLLTEYHVQRVCRQYEFTHGPCEIRTVRAVTSMAAPAGLPTCGSGRN